MTTTSVSASSSAKTAANRSETGSKTSGNTDNALYNPQLENESKGHLLFVLPRMLLRSGRSQKSGCTDRERQQDESGKGRSTRERTKRQQQSVEGCENEMARIEERYHRMVGVNEPTEGTLAASFCRRIGIV